MQHIDVVLNDSDYAQVVSRAQEAGVSVSEWVSGVIHHSAVDSRPLDPLFGILANAPELADALDAVVAERADRVLRAS